MIDNRYQLIDSSDVFTVVEGGVTAPMGFRAAGIHCGIRKNTEKKDLALILADCECAAAAVYTTNRVQAAPIQITKRHLANGKARAILANSGNANACAPDGEVNAQRMCEALSKAADIKAEDIIVNSTGVIGQTLPVAKIEDGMPALVGALRADGGGDAAAAIMTTDLVKKEIAVKFSLGGKTVTIGAMAKGSGMIHPNMATMLAFITTDCNISPEMLQKALSKSARLSYNRVTVDGDTSTNDMAAILASGLAGNNIINSENADYALFLSALNCVNIHLAKTIARDGEGATRLLVCRVDGADTEDAAEKLAKSVISSSLTKAAMFGADANWGRVICAMGYSGVDFNPSSVDIAFESEAGKIEVCKGGMGLDFDEALAKKILSTAEVHILCALNTGAGAAEVYGCDLTYDYVKINGDYRS